MRPVVSRSSHLCFLDPSRRSGGHFVVGPAQSGRFVNSAPSHFLICVPANRSLAYGEVRNGGLPDWFLTKGPTASMTGLSVVRAQILRGSGTAIEGLLWKNGGPVIGVQLENDIQSRTKPAAQPIYPRLKSTAIEGGSRCGRSTPYRMGQCGVSATRSHSCFWRLPDEFCRPACRTCPRIRKASIVPRRAHQRHARILEGRSAGLRACHLALSEVHGGVGGRKCRFAYHRRRRLPEDDIAPMTLTQLGSGVNLLVTTCSTAGTNPQGKRTTLQESQATDTRRPPGQSYDFQAPLANSDK